MGVAAAGTGPAAVDNYTNLNASETAYGQTDPNNLWITLSNTPGGACTVTRITNLQWNVDDLAGRSVGSASITLTRNGGTSNAPGYVVGLYELADNWTDASNWNTTPQPGAQIETKPFPASNGATVVFNSAALATYLQNQINGDGIASFAVRLVSNSGSCSATVSAVFNSSSMTSGRPTLAAATPNAVEVSTASAETATSWPLYAGLAAVALFVVAGVVISKRRTA
jgi:hypothetical protein